VSFRAAPGDWLEMYFRHRPVICDITSMESKKRPWTRMLVRINDRDAFESLHEKKIDVRDILKDAGSGKVFVFYRLLEEAKGVTVDSATTDHKASETPTPQEGGEDVGDTREPYDSVPDDGECSGDDAKSDGDADGADEGCEPDADDESDGDGATVGEGDAADPDSDDDDDTDVEDERTPPSRSSGGNAGGLSEE